MRSRSVGSLSRARTPTCRCGLIKSYGYAVTYLSSGARQAEGLLPRSCSSQRQKNTRLTATFEAPKQASVRTAAGTRFHLEPPGLKPLAARPFGTCLQLHIYTSFLRGSVGGNKVVASLPNTRTLVRGLSLSIMRCASGAQLDVVLAERSIPCKFVGTLHVFLPTFSEDGLLGSQKESLRSHPP